MTWVIGGWPGGNVMSLNGAFGVLPSEMATGGSGSPLLDDVDPGDEATEFAWVFASLPGSGTVLADDTGAFQHTGAADGTYHSLYTLYTVNRASGGVVDRGTGDVVTVFGSGAVNGTAAGVTLTAASSLTSGAAAGQRNVTAAGVTLTTGASLTPGAAAGQQSAVAPGAALTVTASVIAGAASSNGSAVAPGGIITAAASLIPGSATAVRNVAAPGAILVVQASVLAGGAFTGESAQDNPLTWRAAARNRTAQVAPRVRVARAS